MMECSANEIEGLCARAARGAGAGVAQAAHFGRAAVAHLAAGRPGADLFAALQALPGGPVDTLPAQLVGGAGEMRLSAGGHDALAQSYLDALPFRAEVTARSSDALLARLDPGQRRATLLPARLKLDKATWEALSKLAHRTYVPQSDASRLAGAGAGLTDND